MLLPTATSTSHCKRPLKVRTCYITSACSKGSPTICRWVSKRTCVNFSGKSEVSCHTRIEQPVLCPKSITKVIIHYTRDGVDSVGTVDAWSVKTNHISSVTIVRKLNATTAPNKITLTKPSCPTVVSNYLFPPYFLSGKEG